MWGTSINKPWIPLKYLPVFSLFPPHSQPNLHFPVPKGENGCLLTCALASHHDKHSLWLPVPPRSSSSSSLPSSPLFLVTLCQSMNVVSQFCYVSVPTLLALPSFILSSPLHSALYPSTCQAVFSSIPSHNRFPPISFLNQCLSVWAGLLLPLRHEDKKWHQYTFLSSSSSLLTIIIISLKAHNDPFQRGAQAPFGQNAQIVVLILRSPPSLWVPPSPQWSLSCPRFLLSTLQPLFCSIFQFQVAASSIFPFI